MLARPEIADERIINGLRENFGLTIAQVTFLPIGADANSAVFRVGDDAGRSYFLKLRRGNFQEVAVAVPTFLRAQGVHTVMAPIPTVTNQSWVRRDGFHWLLYPFFEGSNGFEKELSKAQWITLGESLKAIHTAALPAELAGQLPREFFSACWRRMVEEFDQQFAGTGSRDPAVADLAAFWTSKRGEIRRIVERAEQLAQVVQSRTCELVLCHSDLHGGNVLVGDADDLAIVDWDEPILAPRERDLMFVGGGVAAVWNRAEEVAWFYEGYGPVAVDPVTLSYYRYERIVTDFAVFTEDILGGRLSADDRELSLRQMGGQFLPGDVVEIADQTYPYVG